MCAADVWSVCDSWSSCFHYLCQGNFIETLCLIGPIPIMKKNWLTFGGDPVQDTDSGSLFHFPHCCLIGDFRKVTICSRLTTVDEMTDVDKIVQPQHTRRHLGRGLRSLSTVLLLVGFY